MKSLGGTIRIIFYQYLNLEILDHPDKRWWTVGNFKVVSSWSKVHINSELRSFVLPATNCVDQLRAHVVSPRQVPAIMEQTGIVKVLACC